MDPCVTGNYSPALLTADKWSGRLPSFFIDVFLLFLALAADIWKLEMYTDCRKAFEHGVSLTSHDSPLLLSSCPEHALRNSESTRGRGWANLRDNRWSKPGKPFEHGVSWLSVLCSSDHEPDQIHNPE